MHQSIRHSQTGQDNRRPPPPRQEPVKQSSVVTRRSGPHRLPRRSPWKAVEPRHARRRTHRCAPHTVTSRPFLLRAAPQSSPRPSVAFWQKGGTLFAVVQQRRPEGVNPRVSGLTSRATRVARSHARRRRRRHPRADPRCVVAPFTSRPERRAAFMGRSCHCRSWRRRRSSGRPSSAQHVRRTSTK